MYFLKIFFQKNLEALNFSNNWSCVEASFKCYYYKYTKYNYLTMGLARALLSRSMKTSKVTLIIVIVCVIKLSIYNIEKGLEDNDGEFVKAHAVFSRLTPWLSYHPFTAIFYSLIIPTIYSRLTLLSPSRCIYSSARPLIGHLDTVPASDWPAHLCCLWQ